MRYRIKKRSATNPSVRQENQQLNRCQPRISHWPTKQEVVSHELIYSGKRTITLLSLPLDNPRSGSVDVNTAVEHTSNKVVPFRKITWPVSALPLPLETKFIRTSRTANSFSSTASPSRTLKRCSKIKTTNARSAGYTKRNSSTAWQ